MRKIALFLLGIVFVSSCGGNDKPTRYVYHKFNIHTADKYTISTGPVHEMSCGMTQGLFTKEALSAVKNKKNFDFWNSKSTPTSIDLYKNKIYWVDLGKNTKIKNNFIKLTSATGVIRLKVIHKDNELLFRMKTPLNGTTLICDFPFRKID
tara:strand:- start:183 stop:635 length:453 start_codon:yes stop_codon:yes gene_type:complete